MHIINQRNTSASMNKGRKTAVERVPHTTAFVVQLKQIKKQCGLRVSTYSNKERKQNGKPSAATSCISIHATAGSNVPLEVANLLEIGVRLLSQRRAKVRRHACDAFTFVYRSVVLAGTAASCRWGCETLKPQREERTR